MPVFGVIGAMDAEIKLLLKSASGIERKRYASMDFYSGQLGGKSVVIVKCGVGKVNAAACAQSLISVFGVGQVLFTGVAGAVSGRLGIGDVVVSEDCVQHDVDATALGYKPGQICFTDFRFFKADRKLVNAVCSAARSLGIRCAKGRILTGDKFVTGAAELSKLREAFGGDCIEMEGAAVAHVCSLNKVPFVIIRSISDKADHSAPVDFRKFVEKSAAVSSSIVQDVLRRVG
ncbi:5'-methylthioadenosine/adenosylhomocysteine nucleosidase [Candidatus Woesearchaeota archaeon]|nr:5'-methylthioadenosine/adenosylhomocysteine nucleosidase [Candidatus Woesearchaeota archaeon]